MRRVPRRLCAVASVAAAMASLSVSALPGAAAATAYERPPGAAPGPVSLPAIPSALAPGRPCTGASPTAAHARPWTAGALGLDRVRELSQGAGVTVGVVDTGVGVSAPALAGRVTAVADAGNDCVGHGSFAAGLIAGRGEDATGGGIAPQARILAVRGTSGTGTPSPGAVAAGIRTAVDRGARVVYVGAALTTGRQELTNAVLYATRKDAVVVAPAAPDAVATTAGGVASAPPARPYFPAFIPQVVAVEDYGQDGSRPQNAPNVFAADLAAPGDAVVGIGPKGAGNYIGSGSSLAAAFVAGTAALVRAYQPRLTAAEVANRLVTSAYPAAKPVLDPYAAVAAVSSPATARPASAAPMRMPGRTSHAARTRALVVASVGGGIVAIVACAAVIVPLGRARGWRPAGGDPV
ncbi:S8 family serine peptidase [Actinoallomurus soli]|uniref:S8 family serine peptidase n=1 Tax=Actinoallomurus soli TaxID=2952535 RepID=UPI002092CED6|nr:S8 family serine peptidase [Actinoallomurus soli]MCO5971957.1 S8 family serine peptidase [Actinoallomurus soli]